MFQNAQWQKPIIQELISRVLFETETRGRVFCIAHVPVTICIAIRTTGLLYLFYNTVWHFERLKSFSLVIFVIRSQDPKLKKKKLFSFFKMLIRCWDTRVQIYPTSARKNLWCSKEKEGISGKMLLSEHKKIYMFKAKTLIEKLGTR